MFSFELFPIYHFFSALCLRLRIVYLKCFRVKNKELAVESREILNIIFNLATLVVSFSFMASNIKHFIHSKDSVLKNLFPFDKKKKYVQTDDTTLMKHLIVKKKNGPNTSKESSPYHRIMKSINQKIQQHKPLNHFWPFIIQFINRPAYK